MSLDILIIFTASFIINALAIFAYSAKLAGGITGRIATAMALMNILLLVSRTANTFYAPLLNKRVEGNLEVDIATTEWLMREVLFIGFIGGLIGLLLARYATKMFLDSVNHLDGYGLQSLIKVGFLKMFDLNYWRHRKHIKKTSFPLPWKVFAASAIVNAIWATSTVSAMLAGALVPEFRATAIHMSAILNGIATIIMYVYCDPYFARVIDRASSCEDSQGKAQQVMKLAASSHVGGLLLGQLILMPGAVFIAYLVTTI